MNCPKCGKELNENQKFCTDCGAKINTKNVNSLQTIIIILLVAWGLGLITFAMLKPDKAQNTTSAETKQEQVSKTPAQTLQQIDELQARYFNIIKRNDVLLQIQDSDEYQQDMKDLNNLFKEVEQKIDKNNYYLQKYYKIKEHYAVNTGNTQSDMNTFASNEYEAVDGLLNETYQAVKAKIPPEDFKQLITSELKWLKEVEDYYKVYEQQGFGTIGSLIHSEYECNMRNFRTLLLMLYF